MQRRHLYLVNATDGSPEEISLDINKPYSGCRVCGAVYQSSLDLNYSSMEEYFDAMLLRKAWSHKHAKTHSSSEHHSLALSGAWCTPAAAHIFAAYGIVALSDMLFSEEHADALLKSKPIPVLEVITGNGL